MELTRDGVPESINGISVGFVVRCCVVVIHDVLRPVVLHMFQHVVLLALDCRVSWVLTQNAFEVHYGQCPSVLCSRGHRHGGPQLSHSLDRAPELCLPSPSHHCPASAMPRPSCNRVLPTSLVHLRSAVKSASFWLPATASECRLCSNLSFPASFNTLHSLTSSESQSSREYSSCPRVFHTRRDVPEGT